MATGRIGVTPNLRTRWSKAPAGGTTSLSGLDDNSVSLVYDAGFEAVYRNGVLLSRGNDYTATNGTTITLVDATIAGDIIEVFANQAIPLTSTYTQAVADAKFINNSLVDAKGDIIAATAADTVARLAVGSNDQVLTADSSTATGLKWATPASGGMTLLASGNLSGTSVSLSSISSAYNDLRLIVRDLTIASLGAETWLRFNNDSSAIYGHVSMSSESNTWSSTTAANQISPLLNDTGIADGISICDIYNYADSSVIKLGKIIQHKNNNNSSPGVTHWAYHTTTAISSIQIISSNGSRSFTAGNYLLYGVK